MNPSFDYATALGEPTFASFEDERRHRKERLAAGFRIFARYGFDQGVAGHISVRDPELTDHFWVNPLAKHFSRIRVSDLVLIDHTGAIVEGQGPVNEAAFAIHSAVHAARPDVVAACHAHTVAGKAWSAKNRLLEPLTNDACAFYEDHEIFDEFNGIVVDPDEGARLAKALGDRKALILRNHGLMSVGPSVDQAVWWFLILDNCCQVQLAADTATPNRLIEHEVALATREQVGNNLAGHLNFQPLWDWIVALEPDLLD